MKWRFGMAAVALSTLAAVSYTRAAEPADQAELRRRADDVVTEVLAQPEFEHARSERSAVQRLGEMVKEWLDGLETATNALPAWVHWVVLVGLIVALVALLANVLYTVSTTTGAPNGTRRAMASRLEGTLLGIADLDYDAVIREAKVARDAEDWERALRYTYAAAILWLDRVGRVPFRASKTNRDYLVGLEGGPGARPFERMTRSFEAAIFGTTPATRPLYESAARDFSDLRDETTEDLAA